MRRSTLLMCALLTIATSGCKQINEQVQKVKAKIAAARQRTRPTQPAPLVPDTQRVAPPQEQDIQRLAPENEHAVRVRRNHCEQ